MLSCLTQPMMEQMQTSIQLVLAPSVDVNITIVSALQIPDIKDFYIGGQSETDETPESTVHKITASQEQ